VDQKNIKVRCLEIAGFSGFPKNYVWRPYLVRGIDDVFATGADVVHVTGRSGIGTTCLAAEYGLHSPAAIVGLFIRGGSRLSYAPFRLAGSLLDQADAYLGTERTPVADVVSAWHARFAQLQETFRREGRELLFIVDGLHQLPIEDQRTVAEIYRDLMAVGVPGVRHLISTGEKHSLGVGEEVDQSRLYRAARLSLQEAESIFSQAGLSAEKFKDYYAYTDGIPALVQSACRLSAAGRDLDGLARELSSFYAAEWDQFQALQDLPVDKLARVLAFMCFSKGALKLDELAEICTTSRDCITELADREIFIRRTSDAVDVEFLSHSHRQFVVAKLGDRKHAVMNLMIDRLAAVPNSDTSLALLPTFYEELGRVDDLIDYLSPENLGSYLDYSRSATALRRRTELGMHRALASAKHVQAYQFALQTSMIRAMDTPQLSPEQLGALAGLGEIEQAFSHGQLARTDEERLHVLSILIRELHRAKLPIPASAEEQVRGLLSRDEVAKGGPWTVEVATNLVGAFPALALKLVEEGEHHTSRDRELAIARLAISEAVRSRGETRKDAVFSRLKNDELRDFVVSLQGVVSAQSVDELDVSTRKLPRPVRAELFRQWAKAHPRAIGAYRVIDIALRDLLKDASYLPTAGDLWDLCSTLASCKDAGVLAELIEKVEGFKGSLSEAGSTIDLVGLDLELAVAHAAAQTIASNTRFEEIYLRVAYLDDIALRLEGFALMTAALRRVTDTSFLSGAASLRESIQKEIPPLVDRLLAETADHLLVFGPSLDVLVRYDPDLVYQIVERFNTEDRRDSGFASMAEELVKQNANPITSSQIYRFLDSIVDRSYRDETIVNVLRILSSTRRLKAVDIQELIEGATVIVHPVLRCQAMSQVVGIDFEPGKRLDRYLGVLREALKQIDRSASRPREAFRFVQAVIGKDKAEGRRIYKEVEGILSAFRVTNESWLNNSYLSARAATTALGALIEKAAFGEDDLARLLSAVDAVPSISMRIDLYVDLALRAHSKRHNQLFDDLCGKQIYPVIANIAPDDVYTLQLLTVEAFPCLFVWNEPLALDILKRCDKSHRETAVAKALDYVVTGLPCNEPFKADRLAHLVLDYPRAMHALELLALLDTDAALCEKTELVCQALSRKGSRNLISGHQRDALVLQMRKLGEAKLPDAKNISHQGWVILFRAFLGLVADYSKTEWDSFVQLADGIGNRSDKVYILGCLSKLIPEKFVVLRNAALNRARDALTQIPSVTDAMMRRIGLSDVALGLEKAVAERFLKEALEASKTIRDREAALNVQRNIIDAAQQIDKSLAERLIDLVDDDPARGRAKTELRQAAKALKRKEAVSEGDYKSLVGLRADALTKACFDALVSLNNGKVAPPRVEELTPLLPQLSLFPIRDVFWGYVWILRACQERLEHTEEAYRTLRPILEVTLLTCELNQRLAVESDPMLLWRSTDDQSSIVVGPTDRLDAIGFITSWFDRQKCDQLLICDPYFTLQDIELIKELHFVRKEVGFTIISCKPAAAPGGADAISNLASAWASVCEQPAPEIKLIVALYDGEKLQGPVHDRWILCGESGLRIGTSLNSLGLTKLSAISHVAGPELQNLWAGLSRFVSQQERSADGRRLRYLSESI
jgi:hypothetical protein